MEARRELEQAFDELVNPMGLTGDVKDALEELRDKLRDDSKHALLEALQDPCLRSIDVHKDDELVAIVEDHPGARSVEFVGRHLTLDVTDRHLQLTAIGWTLALDRPNPGQDESDAAAVERQLFWRDWQLQ